MRRCPSSTTLQQQQAFGQLRQALQEAAAFITTATPPSTLSMSPPAPRRASDADSTRASYHTMARLTPQFWRRKNVDAGLAGRALISGTASNDFFEVRVADERRLRQYRQASCWASRWDPKVVAALGNGKSVAQ